MNTPPIIRPLQSILRGRLLPTARPAPKTVRSATLQLRPITLKTPTTRFRREAASDDSSPAESLSKDQSTPNVLKTDELNAKDLDTEAILAGALAGSSIPEHGLGETATPETSSGASKTKKQAKPKKAASAAPKATAKASATAKDKKGDIALPRSLELLYMDAPKRKAKYGVPTCDLQLRSYSVRNLEFFCDFALRAAYYLGLPASGPVPLPRLRELWTVPKSHFIFKKSQENFSRITLRRLIQIKDGHPEAVQVWLAFLQKHAYYGIGMKANMWEFSSLNVGESMDKSAEEMKKLLKEKFDEHMVVWPEPKGVGEDLEDFFAKERLRASGGR